MVLSSDQSDQSDGSDRSDGSDGSDGSDKSDGSADSSLLTCWADMLTHDLCFMSSAELCVICASL